MDGDTVFSMISVTLGGLALFLFGIHIMTRGLQAVAGDRLRWGLALANRNRLAGISLGTAFGFLIHSSAASAMTVGLVNAGLIRLAGALPILFGANIGTTLSMQVISLQLTDLAFVAIAAGFAVSTVTRRETLKHAGRALLGIGLLFLGMELMSGAIEPHQETMRPWLERIDGTTWRGMLAGIVVAAAFTAIIQSSGATIGMCFVLISAGVFTQLEQVYPLVLGAHIGTSATALLASIGTGIEARRAAIGNLGFNLFNTLLAVAAAPLFLAAIPLTAENLVHQTANLHTAVMLVAAIILLPFSGLCASLVTKATPSRKEAPPGTYLDTRLITTPEDALRASIQELGRGAEICLTSLRLSRNLLDSGDRTKTRAIRRNEVVINEIKTAFRGYLRSLARRRLSRRQALLANYLNHIVDDLERIGDHIERLADLLPRITASRDVTTLDQDKRRLLSELHERTEAVLCKVTASLDARKNRFREGADQVLRERDRYVESSKRIRRHLDDKVAEHEITPAAGLLLSEYVLICNRLVRHCRMIAAEESQRFFRIKGRKLGRTATILDRDE